MKSVTVDSMGTIKLNRFKLLFGAAGGTTVLEELARQQAALKMRWEGISHCQYVMGGDVFTGERFETDIRCDQSIFD